MSLASTSCYWPNGQLVTQYNYQPCNAGSDPKHAACCDLRTSVCTQFGYCFGNANYIYRGGCTDSTWSSSSCAQACSFEVEADLSNFANIYDCGNGVGMATQNQSWCCASQDGSSCCQNRFEVSFGQPYFPTSTTSTTTASTSTTVSSSAKTNSTTAATTGSAASTTPSPAHDSSTRSIGIGVGVGVSIGALLVAIMAFLIFKERKRRVTAEQRFQAMTVAGAGAHDPFSVAKPELEQPSYNSARVPYARMHEANSQSLYEVQG
ncbi:uncharacterized protein A1O5_00840 [Cladophialophora psammophila CBS 110553]|uniref:Mid2 domain-containing protein n=1 Tax=Cladophialophora psammophila CBS 110553 TaxID=1182543 RepID=W9X7B1_9EURO|nr:uncharacterized protein A1O5_00840 [Cladophialophora psammophila CBS 110553]EXJ76332.1 hypothetical protein A1O5_00840 [Cladophialophora psammophila CBS 110553]